MNTNLTIPISNETIDDIEMLAEQLNDATKLDEKIKLHAELNEYVNKIENTVDAMRDMLDNIDIIKTTDENKQEYDASIDLDVLLSELKNEEVLQNKLNYMKTLYEHIKICKQNCEKNKLVITKCN